MLLYSFLNEHFVLVVFLVDVSSSIHCFFRGFFLIIDVLIFCCCFVIIKSFVHFFFHMILLCISISLLLLLLLLLKQVIPLPKKKTHRIRNLNRQLSCRKKRIASLPSS
uniref:Uncharacterized protein n=1 Tax=Haematobia irritans TaxID=7368 RepID=A0A1L8E9J4_HAEIR